LADFVIEHYYPQCQGAQKYVDFFNQVVKRTAKMLADWQAQGFAHGVMQPLHSNGTKIFANRGAQHCSSICPS
jgi:hypothetical protein